jgi:hypothetical protein
MPEHLQELFRAITILHTGGRHDHRTDQSTGITENMPLGAFDLFAGIAPVDPPFSVVLTCSLSMLAALGWRRFPAATRISPRRKSCMYGQVPSFRQRQKYG